MVSWAQAISSKMLNRNKWSPVSRVLLVEPGDWPGHGNCWRWPSRHSYDCWYCSDRYLLYIYTLADILMAALLVLFWQISSLHIALGGWYLSERNLHCTIDILLALHSAHTVYVCCRYLQYSTSDIILTDIWPPYLRPTSANNRSNLWHKSWVHSAGRSVMGVSILSLTGQSDGAKTGPTITRTYLSK